MAGGRSTDRVTQHRLIWIEYGELFQKFFRFSQSVSLLKDDVGTNGARCGGDEFNNCLMRQAPSDAGGGVQSPGRANGTRNPFRNAIPK